MRINEKYWRTLIACELRASLFRYKFMNTDMNQILMEK